MLFAGKGQRSEAGAFSTNYADIKTEHSIFRKFNALKNLNFEKQKNSKLRLRTMQLMCKNLSLTCKIIFLTEDPLTKGILIKQFYFEIQIR